MPDLVTLFEMAKESGAAHVCLFEARCTPVQHRRSSCKKCVEICPQEAITLHDRVIKVDRALCVGCGACTTVCPTEGIVSVNPAADALAGAAISAMLENEKRAVIACERVVVREAPEPGQFAQVPCLCRVHESLLIDLVARGAREIILVDGGCKNCKYRSVSCITAQVTETANQMLAAANCSVRVVRQGTFPEWVSAAQHANLGESRREAFTQARGSAQGTIGRAVKFLARKEKQEHTTTGAIVGALGVNLEEALPERPQRQEKLVNALFEVALQNGHDFSQVGGAAAGAAADAGGGAESNSAPNPKALTPEIDTRFFGALHYDTNKCTECGICSAVCRHKALVRSKRKTAAGKNVFLEFTPSLCTQCRLCEEVCFRSAMSVSSTVRLRDLFSFEPTLIVIDD